MRIESRRHRIEKSDLDSLKEINWNHSNSLQTSQNNLSKIQSIKDLLDWCSEEETIFNEQEAGKATVYTPLQDKESMEEETERYEKELSERSAEILSRIADVFER